MNLFDLLLYGRRVAEKKAQFQADLRIIEDQYVAWFRSRAAVREGEPHDQLRHHYILDQRFGQVRFRFAEDTALPDEIQARCMEAFYRNFR